MVHVTHLEGNPAHTTKKDKLPKIPCCDQSISECKPTSGTPKGTTFPEEGRLNPGTKYLLLLRFESEGCGGYGICDQLRVLPLGLQSPQWQRRLDRKWRSTRIQQIHLLKSQRFPALWKVQVLYFNHLNHSLTSCGVRIAGLKR